MRSVFIIATIACLCAIASVVTACGGGGSSATNTLSVPRASPALPTAPPAPTPTPIFLNMLVVGTPAFPPGDTATGGQGAPVDGIPCDNAAVGFHIHAHLSLFYRGVQMAFPLAIGIMNPVFTNNGQSAPTGSCFYHLHTHDSSGIIHIENQTVTTFTLGEVFDIWGEPLTRGNVAGFMGPTLVYIGTTVFNGDPRTIQLSKHELITIEVGGPYVWPILYTFPS